MLRHVHNVRAFFFFHCYSLNADNCGSRTMLLSCCAIVFPSFSFPNSLHGSRRRRRYTLSPLVCSACRTVTCRVEKPEKSADNFCSLFFSLLTSARYCTNVWELTCNASTSTDESVQTKLTVLTEQMTRWHYHWR